LKLVIFDMDGVLVDACEWHRVALNKALQEISGYQISVKDHFSEYNGIPTKVKLKKLVEKGHVRASDVEEIEKEKQRKTVELIERSACERTEKIELMKHLKKKGIKIACYTNSVRETTELMLERTGILSYFDLLITNQDVTNPKPHPEGYLACIERMQLSPSDCLIIEDSPKGIEAATATGSRVMVVQSPDDVTIESIERFIE